VRLIFFVIPSLLFFLFDTLVPSAAAVIKVQGEDGLPAGRRLKSGIKEIKVAAWAISNVFLGIAVQGLLEYLLTNIFQVKSALKVTTTLPLPWGIVKDLVRGLMAREVRDILSVFLRVFRFANSRSGYPIHPSPLRPPFKVSYSRRWP
jgi:hypothetical protein